jgi:pimeloyl-ACP methyl ester carboxylesterase
MHPAIILLHGSGPLTRYSFGPYPHFFASLGLAVLVYDKRGSGASTGIRMDASTTGSQGRIVDDYYPNGLADDALAAFRFLQGRRDIDPRQIGVWGSSEGGMLATYVASRSPDIAFAINSSGFMGRFSETFLYQLGASLRASGVPPDQIDEALTFGKLWLKVSRTGEDYQGFLKERENAVRQKRPWVSSREPPSLEQMRWDWAHVLSFDPLPALAKVRCPVLGMWGQLDTLTDVTQAESNMKAVLSRSGNKDFTLKVFANANHPLMEMPSERRMAPGVFDTLRSWIGARAELKEPVPNP